MANILGELFQNQANAIREGLGDIGGIAPLETPSLIRQIVSMIGTGEGGGGSGGSSNDLVLTAVVGKTEYIQGGSVTATASFTIPSISKVYNYSGATNDQNTSSTTNYPSVYLPSSYNASDVTVSTSGDNTIYKVSKTVSGTNVGVHAILCVTYSIPGLHLDSNDATILRATPETTALPPAGYAFSGMGLKRVELGQGTFTSVGEYLFAKESQLSFVELPPSATLLKPYAFYYCGLPSVELNYVTEVQNYAFHYCGSLKTATLRNLQKIGQAAFHSCSALETVVLGNVTSVGRNAFTNCYNLRTVDFTSCTAVPTSASNVFYNCPETLQILVPAALYDEWVVATNWANYASMIVAV